MLKQVAEVGVLFLAFSQFVLAQQNKSDLATLIPFLYGPRGLIVDSDAPLAGGVDHSAHFNSSFQSEFTQINVSIASQLLTLPLPSPASGFTYTFDPTLGVFTRSTQSFGPILAERAETIGKKKVNVGFSYQHFNFDTIEGIPLNNIPAVFTHDDAILLGGREDVVTTTSRIEEKIQQSTFFATIGLTNRVDVSVAVPFISNDLNVVSDATIQRIGTTNPAIHFFSNGQPGNPGYYGNTRQFSSSGHASGIGDVTIRLKATAVRWEHGGLAFGTDVRAPTGDEMNLLGSGGTGIKPFAAFSYNYKRIAPRFNVGYQWNGKSVLAGDVLTGTKKSLPNQFLYVVGADVGLASRLSLAVDLLGQRIIDAPRLVGETFTTLVHGIQFPNVTFNPTSSFNLNNGSIGLKFNPFGGLLINANMLLKLDNGGMRDKITPLVGLSYTF
jgi:outer membrane putative beta-barrel porin/alpha-amylase